MRFWFARNSDLPLREQIVLGVRPVMQFAHFASAVLPAGNPVEPFKNVTEGMKVETFEM